MLDTRVDVRRRSSTATRTTTSRRERILDNRFYRNVSGALSGTQEYMAMEKLHELHEEGGYDLIVVDTPPTRHALDFLDAPQRLIRLLDNRIFRLLMMPTRTVPARRERRGADVPPHRSAKVVGSEVIDDVVAFFRAFEGMEQGFRDRADERRRSCSRDPATAFVLVTSPRRDAVEEAEFFAEQLASSELAVDALVVNRVHPRFGERPRSRRGCGPRRRARDARRSRARRRARGRARLAARYENLADFAALAARASAGSSTAWRDRIGAAAVAYVPYLAHDVYDFARAATRSAAHLSRAASLARPLAAAR